MLRGKIKMSVLYLAIAIVLPGFLAAVIDMKYIAKSSKFFFARFVLYAAVITWFILFFKICIGGIAASPDELFPELTKFVKCMISAFALSVALPVVLFRRVPKVVSDIADFLLGRFLPFAVAATLISALSFIRTAELNAVTIGSLFKFVSVFIISIVILPVIVKFLPKNSRRQSAKYCPVSVHFSLETRRKTPPAT